MQVSLHNWKCKVRMQLLPLYAPSFDPRVAEKKKLTAGQVANRFLEMQIYRNRPMLPNLSGLKLEYAILPDIQQRCRAA